MQSIVVFGYASLVQSWGDRLWCMVHWGPIFGIIVQLITILTTIHFYVQLYFPLLSVVAMVHFFSGLFVILSLVFFYMSAILDGPGFVPSGWSPARKRDRKHLQYCDKCECFKPPRSHHCTRCKQCVLKMDHHCVWLNGCVGFQNQNTFYLTLVTAVAGAVYSMGILGTTLYRVIHFIPNENNQYVYLSMRGLVCIIVSLAIDMVALLGFGPLLFVQTKTLIQNQTMIENVIVAKAVKRKRDLPFVYPYNVGIWANIYQVMFESSLDGFTWPVREDCHQFTLTDEQIEQRRQLLENGATYRIIRPYDGTYLPLFSQGLFTTLFIPWSVKPRLDVELGDRVLVIQTNKYWLYGIKINSKPQAEGWLPEQCALFVHKQSDASKGSDLKANYGSNKYPDSNNNDTDEISDNEDIDSELESDSNGSSDFSLNELVTNLLQESAQNCQDKKED